MVLDITSQNRVYARFDEKLIELNILSTKVGYYHSNYVDVTVDTIEEMLKAKHIIAGQRTELSELFASAWLEQGGSINPEYYGSGTDLYFQVYSEQERYINRLIREARDQISESVNTKLTRELIPKYFFCHSSNYDNANYPPGYNIVFKDPIALRESEPEAQQIIKAECLRLLNESDIKNRFEDKYFEISFFDATDKHMYGLSRED